MDSYLEQNTQSKDVRDIDMHGRRVRNAGRALKPRDYVTRQELDEAIISLVVFGAADDSDILTAVTGLSIVKQSGNSSIGGNAFEVDFSIPSINVKSYDGYTIVLHNASTLPSTTSFDSGTNGSIVEGVTILSDSSKAWVVNALVGKDIEIFSSKRAGSPTFDGEASIILARITANTATTITFEMGSHYQGYTQTGISYYIVTPGGGNYWFEKVKYYTPFIRDAYGPDTRKVRFEAGLATIYAWAIPHNYWGYGEVGSPATSTYDGIITTEIKLLAVDNGRIAALAVTFDKINVSQLSAIAVDAGSLTAGIITGALIQTDAAANTGIKLNGSTFSAYDGTNLRTRIDSSGSYPGDIYTAHILGVSNGLSLESNSSASGMAISNAGISIISASAIDLNFSGITNGGGISGTFNASDITSGTLSNSRLNSNVAIDGDSPSFAALTLSAGSLSVASGQGMASGGTSFVCASDAEIYESSTKRAAFNAETKFSVGGTLKTVNIISEDHGSGAKDYVYLT